MVCKGVVMLIHNVVGNPLQFQNFLSGSVIQDNYSVSYTTDYFYLGIGIVPHISSYWIMVLSYTIFPVYVGLFCHRIIK